MRHHALRRILAAAKKFEYLLRFIGVGTNNQTFINGQVLDTPEEGMQDGQMTVIQTGVNASDWVKLVSGWLSVSTDLASAAWNKNRVLADTIIPRQKGQGLYCKFKIKGALNGYRYCGWTEAGTVSCRAILNGATQSLVLQGSPVVTIESPCVLDKEYELFSVLLDAGVHNFVRKEGESVFTLLRISSDGTGSLQADVDANYQEIQVANFLAPDKLYTEQITPVFYDEFDGAAGSFDDTRIPNKGSYIFVNSDCRLDGVGNFEATAATFSFAVLGSSSIGRFNEWVLKYTGTVTSSLLFQVGTRWETNNNQIRIRYDSVSDVLSLVETDGGINSDLDSASYTMVDGDVIKASDDGVNINVYVNDTLLLNGVSAVAQSGMCISYGTTGTDASNKLQISSAKSWDIAGYEFDGVDE
jgi:hypothetical protein